MVFGQNLPTPQKIGIERWMVLPFAIERMFDGTTIANLTLSLALALIVLAVTAASYLKFEHFNVGLFAIGRHASAGFTILYVEIWSCWSRLRGPASPA